MKKLFPIIISIMSLMMVGCSTPNETGLTSSETVSTSSEAVSSSYEEESLTLNDISGEYVLIDDSSENEQKITRIIIFPNETCNIHKDYATANSDFLNTYCSYSYDPNTSYIMFSSKLTDGFVGLATIEDNKIMLTELLSRKCSLVFEKRVNE